MQEDIIWSRGFTRSHICIICNDTRIHKCYNIFITQSNILVLLVRRFDYCLCKLIGEFKSTVPLKIGNHDHTFNGLIKHHVAIITGGYHTALGESDRMN